VTGAEDAGSGQHDRPIADGVVPAAQPNGTHVGIARAEGIKQQGHRHIGEEGEEGNHAHGEGFRRRTEPGIPAGLAEDEDTEARHGESLDQGGAGAPQKPHGQDGQGEGVIARIAEKIRGIGKERRGACIQPRHHLHHEHGGVDAEGNPQGAAKARVEAFAPAGVGTATAFRHDRFLILTHGGGPKIAVPADGLRDRRVSLAAAGWKFAASGLTLPCPDL